MRFRTNDYFAGDPRRDPNDDAVLRTWAHSKRRKREIRGSLAPTRHTGLGTCSLVGLWHPEVSFRRFVEHSLREFRGGTQSFAVPDSKFHDDGPAITADIGHRESEFVVAGKRTTGTEARCLRNESWKVTVPVNVEGAA